MAIDELTDNALYKLYQEDENARKIVEAIQKKYGVHVSQNPGRERSEKEEQEHRKKVVLANKEIKETVKQYLAQQKQGLEEKTEISTSANTGNRRLQYATGLIGLVAIVAALSTFGATAPLTALSYGTAAAYPILPLY